MGSNREGSLFHANFKSVSRFDSDKRWPGQLIVSYPHNIRQNESVLSEKRPHVLGNMMDSHEGLLICAYGYHVLAKIPLLDHFIIEQFCRSS